MNKVILNTLAIGSILIVKTALAAEGPIQLRYQLEEIALKMQKSVNTELDCKKFADYSKKYFEKKCDDEEKFDRNCYSLKMDTYNEATERVGEYPSSSFKARYTISLSRGIDYKGQADDLLSMNVRFPSWVNFAANTVKTNFVFQNGNDVYRLAKTLDLAELKKISETQFEVSNRLMACAMESGGVVVNGRGTAEVSTSHPDERMHREVLRKSHVKAVELEKTELSFPKKFFQLGSVVGESIRILKPNLEPNDLERLSASALGILINNPESGFDVRQKNNTNGTAIAEILNQKFYQENLKFYVEGLELK